MIDCVATLNGDILVWNSVTKRRHELTSMGIRVTAETLKQQLTISKQLDFMQLPYHPAILNNQIPLPIGGGNRAVADVDAVAAQSASWGSQRYGVAEGGRRCARGRISLCWSRAIFGKK